MVQGQFEDTIREVNLCVALDWPAKCVRFVLKFELLQINLDPKFEGREPRAHYIGVSAKKTKQ